MAHGFRSAERQRPRFPPRGRHGWTKDDWDVFRSNGWRTACKRVQLVAVPRPYDLRHSFASLLLAEGRTVHYVAAQLGHSPVLTLSTYGHLIAEYEDAGTIDAEQEIARAREGDPRCRSIGIRSCGLVA
jgi:integrase